MDPDLLFEELIAALARGDRFEAVNFASDLADWISRRGYVPVELQLLHDRLRRQEGNR